MKSSELGRIAKNGFENVCTLSTSLNSYCFEGEEMYAYVCSLCLGWRDILHWCKALWQCGTFHQSHVCPKFAASTSVHWPSGPPLSTYCLLCKSRYRSQRGARVGQYPVRGSSFQRNMLSLSPGLILSPEDGGNMFHPHFCMVSQPRRLQFNQSLLWKPQSMNLILRDLNVIILFKFKFVFFIKVVSYINPVRGKGNFF
jgi:hypothetical protein